LEKNAEMSIWFKEYEIEEWEQMLVPTIHSTLGIKITKIGPDFIEGTMPVDSRTHQPFGVLHGGASVVLAESLGSMAANMLVDPEAFYCVGQNIYSNHLRPVSSGLVTGKATAIHIGKKTQLWEIEIRDESSNIVNTSRLSMAVLPKRK